MKGDGPVTESSGSEWLFRVDSLPYDMDPGLALTYIEQDELGMKFIGDLPYYWNCSLKRSTGPYLYDDERIYRVVKVDYANNLIWLEENN